MKKEEATDVSFLDYVVEEANGEVNKLIDDSGAIHASNTQQSWLQTQSMIVVYNYTQAAIFRLMKSPQSGVLEELARSVEGRYGASTVEVFRNKFMDGKYKVAVKWVPGVKSFIPGLK